MVETLIAALTALLRGAANQLGGTFLAPQSSFSLAALAVSFALLVTLAVPHGRKRRVRPAVLARALFPKRLWRSASGRADIAWFVLGLAFAGVLIGWAVFTATQVHALLGAALGTRPALLPGWAGGAVATLALFLAYEFGYWAHHYTMHRVPALWHFHKVHHSAESLSLLTNGRVHPLESILFHNMVALAMGTMAALLGASIGEAAPFGVGGTNALILLAAVVVTHLQHSHLWVHFGPFWGRWLLGPAHHQIHHSASREHFDRNLGSSLALFDRLFGTFHMPAHRRERLRFGVDDGEAAPHGLRAATIEPFLAAAGVRRPKIGQTAPTPIG